MPGRLVSDHIDNVQQPHANKSDSAHWTSVLDIIKTPTRYRSSSVSVKLVPILYVGNRDDGAVRDDHGSTAVLDMYGSPSAPRQ